MLSGDVNVFFHDCFIFRFSFDANCTEIAFERVWRWRSKKMVFSLLAANAQWLMMMNLSVFFTFLESLISHIPDIPVEIFNLRQYCIRQLSPILMSATMLGVLLSYSLFCTRGCAGRHAQCGPSRKRHQWSDPTRCIPAAPALPRRDKYIPEITNTFENSGLWLCDSVCDCVCSELCNGVFCACRTFGRGSDFVMVSSRDVWIPCI